MGERVDWRVEAPFQLPALGTGCLVGCLGCLRLASAISAQLRNLQPWRKLASGTLEDFEVNFGNRAPLLSGLVADCWMIAQVARCTVRCQANAGQSNQPNEIQTAPY